MINFFGDGEDSRQKTKIILLLGLAGVFIILLVDLADSFTTPPSPEDTREEEIIEEESSTKSLEQELAELLSQVAGVGEVSVQITFASTSERIYARNTMINRETTTEEKEGELTQSRKRNNKEKEVVILNKGGGEEAVVKKELKPVIDGVLIVAEGAEQAQIRADLISAVKRGLGVSSHKISVLPKER